MSDTFPFSRVLIGYLAVLAFVCLIGCEEGAPPLVESLPPPIPVSPTIELERAQCDPSIFTPGSVVPRRLTNLEYQNTVRDLFEVELSSSLRFPAEEETLGFDNNARALQVTPLHAERIMFSAETVAATVVSQLPRIIPCTDDDDPEICIDAFIAAYGPRIWRRPISDEERARFLALFEVGRMAGQGSFDEGATLLLEGLLQSPHFLYRIEVGVPVPDQPGIHRLTSYEMASKLSYFLWRTLPDEVLFEAARIDGLQTATDIEAQVERMLKDDRSKAAFWTFFAQWLHLDELDGMVRDERLHPYFGDQQRDELANQVRQFIDETVWSNDGSIQKLFGQPYRLPSDPPHAQRVGILGQPALLAVTSKPNMTSPIHRGVFVREQLLCATLPPPPPDIMVVAPDPDPNLTTREIFEIHTADAACSGCHNLIDPIGLGLENFDELGRWRDSENGRPIDVSGLVTRTLDMDGPFNGLAELGTRMASSEHIHRCVTKQVFRFGLGRGETDGDICTIDDMYAGYQEANYDFRALIRALATHPAFAHRSVGGHR